MPGSGVVVSEILGSSGYFSCVGVTESERGPMDSAVPECLVSAVFVLQGSLGDHAPVLRLSMQGEPIPLRTLLFVGFVSRLHVCCVLVPHFVKVDAALYFQCFGFHKVCLCSTTFFWTKAGRFDVLVLLYTL